MFLLALPWVVDCSNKSSTDGFFGGDGSSFGQIGDAALSISPITYAFPPTRTFTTTAPVEMTIANVTNFPIFLTSIGVPASQNYSVQSTTCPIGGQISLDKGNKCTLQVAFNPVTVGPVDWSIVVAYNGGAGTQQYSSVAAVTGIGATDVIFPGVASIDQVRSHSVRANWVNVPNQNGYACFTVNGTALTLITTVPKDSTSCVMPGLDSNTTYQIRVRAFDYFAGLDVNTTNLPVTTKRDPSLTVIPGMTYFTPAGALLATNTLAVDINNTVSGDDADMTYGCSYDTLIDGTLTGGTNCSALPGMTLSPGFAGVRDTVNGNGQFSWTPPLTVAGSNFEIFFTGSDGSVLVTEIVAANVRAPYKFDNTLLAAYQPQVAFGANAGTNSPFTSTWQNLSSVGSSLDLTLGSGTFTTGWLGDGSFISNPHRLSFAGNTGATADRAIGGSGLNGLSTFMFTTWIKPASLTPATPGYILGNKGSTAQGFTLGQAANGNFIFSVGLAVTGSYSAAVIANSPVAYFKFNDAGSATAHDEISGTNFATTNSGSIASSIVGAYAGSTAFDFTASGAILLPAPISVASKQWTIAAWIKTPLPNDGQWKTLVRGTASDHIVIFNQTTNEFGSYLPAYGGFVGCGVTTNTLSAGWHHFAAVGATTTTRYYIDGAYVSSYTGGTSSDNFYSLGNYQGGGQPMYFVDDLALFTATLTDTQINNIYSGTVGGCGVAPTTGWNFLAGIFDGTTASLYLGKNLVCQYTPPAAALTGVTQPFTIGAQSDGTTAWAGQVGSTYVYSSGVGADVTTNYNAEYPLYGYPASCKSWLGYGSTVSGTYTIDPDGSGPITPFPVYCDMTTDGGGYTFLKVNTGSALDAAAAETYCSTKGMHLLIPRTANHRVSSYNVALNAAIAPDADANYIYMLGIYPKTMGATCASQPLISTNPTCGYAARDGGPFYINPLSNITEPNGNNCTTCSMYYTWNVDGTINHYDDNGDVTSPGKFICDVGDKLF